MELIILSQTNDDKGKQLEKLTSSILIKLGYSNVNTNEISLGGNEIDVTAEFTQPGVSKEYKRLLVCECKALKTAITTNDWMKFLGKIFTSELGGQNVDGCFIALNGANGNVKGHYRALKGKRNDIHLVSGDELFNVLAEIYHLINPDELYKSLVTLTKRKVLSIATCYYEETLYWLIAFSDGCYTLLNHGGKVISPVDSIRVQALVEKNMDYKSFVDLKEDNDRKIRQELAEKYIISMLLISTTALHFDEIHQQCNAKHGKFPVETFDISEIQSGLNTLIETKIVATDRKTYQLKASRKGASGNDAINLFRLFFKEFFIVIALGCSRYKSLITENLLLAIAEVQGNLPIPEEKKEDWLKILRWSPSALGWAVHPDPFILQHRGEPLNDMMNASDIAYFNQKLSTQFSSDFTNQALGNYFFNQCGLIELETEQNLKIKNTKEILMQLDFKERIKLGLLQHDHGEQIIALRLLPDQPEPWEERFFAKDVNNSDNDEK